MPKRSLSIELHDFFSNLSDPDPATKSAFSQQRIKLLPLFFQVWNRFLVDAFYTNYGDSIERWKGFRLLAVDGSTSYLVNTTDVAAEFGLQCNNRIEIPMARIMQIHDVLNDIAIWGDMFPIIKSEKVIIADRIERLYKDSLTLFDRGFPSYRLMYLMINQEESRNFVIRCSLSFSKVVCEFVKSDAISQTLDIVSTYKSKKRLKERGYLISGSTPIKIRMVKVTLTTGETEVLLTNLYDENEYPSECFGHLYSLRWGVETSYGMQKNQQQIEQYSGHRARCIQQDYHAGLFALNLQVLVEKQCEVYLGKINLRRKHNYKINKNISRSFLKQNIVKLFLWQEPEIILLQLQKLFEHHVEPRRPDRHSIRHKKVTRINGKYQTLTNYKRCI